MRICSTFPFLSKFALLWIFPWKPCSRLNVLMRCYAIKVKSHIQNITDAPQSRKMPRQRFSPCSSCSPRLCKWKEDTPDWCKSCPLFLQCSPSSWILSPLSRIWLPGPLWILSWLVQPKEASSMFRALLPLLSEPPLHLGYEISSVFSNCHWYLHILLLSDIIPFSCLFS